MGKPEDWAKAKRLSNTENLSYDLWVTEDTQPFVLALYIYLAVLKNRSDAQSEWQATLDEFMHGCGDTILTAVSEVPNLVGDWNAVKNRPFSEAWSRFEPRWNGLWDEMSSEVGDIIDPYNRRWHNSSENGFLCLSVDFFLIATRIPNRLLRRQSKIIYELLQWQTGIESAVWRSISQEKSKAQKGFRRESREKVRGQGYFLKRETTLAKYADCWVQLNIPAIPGGDTPSMQETSDSE